MGFVNSNLATLRHEVGELIRVIDAYAAADGVLAAYPQIEAAIAEAKAAADLDFLRQDIGPLIAESLDGLQRVRGIVQDLRDFSRVGSAEWQFACLEAGLDSTLNIVLNEVGRKADIRKEYAGLPEIECVAAQLNQVFMNLLLNAAHAIETRGTITLRSGFDPQQVWIEVQDTGRGIPPENMNRIFEPFFTTKPVGMGTGLGLSLAYGIVGRHHGRIEVESEPGVGTRFRVVLPRRRPADAEANR